MEISRKRNERFLTIRPPRYINKILECFKIADSKPHSTPMVKKGPLESCVKEKEVLNVPYRDAIGSLLYLVSTKRPAITFAVNILSRQQYDPINDDWRCVKRIFRYLQSTKDVELSYTGKTLSLIHI